MRIGFSTGFTSLHIQFCAWQIFILFNQFPQLSKFLAVDQIEVNPLQQQIDTQKFLLDNSVQVEAWAPFAEGKNNIFQNELLLSITAKHKKSVAQVILRWLVQRGIIALSKSTRKERMIENINVFDFELNAEDMAAIATLDTKTSSFFNHRNPEMVR